MSLADLYRERYGDEGSEKVASETFEKTAEEQLNDIIESLSDEECTKLAMACEVLDDEGLEFDDGLAKIAAAAEVVDAAEEVAVEDEQTEKVAEDALAMGRLIGRGIKEELGLE